MSRGKGQPTKMTEKTIKLLSDAFSWDWSVEKCCHYAGISHTAYYNWIKKNPDYVDRFAMLRESGPDNAQRLLIEKAKTDTNTARWLLERRRSDKFASQQKIDVNHTLTLDSQLLDTIQSFKQIEQQEEDDVIEAEVVDKSLLPDLGD